MFHLPTMFQSMLQVSTCHRNIALFTCTSVLSEIFDVHTHTHTHIHTHTHTHTHTHVHTHSHTHNMSELEAGIVVLETREGVHDVKEAVHGAILGGNFPVKMLQRRTVQGNLYMLCTCILCACVRVYICI